VCTDESGDGEGVSGAEGGRLG